MYMRRDMKIQSFSLIEMLVVLVLSGIVLSILYFAYFGITTYQLRLVRKVDKQEELGLMFYTLKSDVERSTILRLREQSIIDCYRTREQLDVSYYFDAPNVVRQQLHRIDTFHCSIERPVFSFQGVTVTDVNAVVDQIRLVVDASQTPLELDINKLYDAASLINAIPNDTTRGRN